MKEVYVKFVAHSLGVNEWQIQNCAQMFEDGNTIPFISRYRKEKTGGMDDASVAEVKHWVDVFAAMEKRKETVISAAKQAGALSPELEAAIAKCVDSQELEDIYLPFKPKRRTRATVAKEKGLEPLADLMWNRKTVNPSGSAVAFVGKNGVESVEDALAGARDIVAERLGETPLIRQNQREMMRRRRLLAGVTKSGKESGEASKYRSYFNFSTPLEKIPSHNLLAILRAENEGFLKVSLDADPERCSGKIYYDFCQLQGRPEGGLARQIRLSAEDAFSRLVEPTVSREVIREAKEKADTESIKVFGENLRQLLLGAPLGQKRIMAVDPGFRNGCKIACLDERGDLLHHTIIFPHPPANEKVKSIMAVEAMVRDYGIQAIAVGNGTASRETVDFLKKVGLPQDCRIWTVSEDGASIYSTSEVAREEFPDQDVTVRGAVSIGRRLMDPLAELVKIDPKNLGIGQYQHDVDQTRLREMLSNTVEYCVNSVGVNLNTASPYLLSYVAGIGPALSRSIVEYRNANGGFRERRELLKVPRLGSKAFEQCAGFLRIRDGKNPLDNSSVHPESYPVVERMAADLGVSVSELVGNAGLCAKIEPSAYVSPEVGLPTVNDILKELVKPGLDPRSVAAEFSFADDVREMEDLKIGMELPGIVTNITNFGAFVDVGLHENGLIHVSRLGPRGTDPSRVLRLHQQIKVRVMDVDLDRNRISLDYVKS